MGEEVTGRPRAYRESSPIAARMAADEPMNTTRGTQQPNARPAFRCRPERVRGIPICLDILPFIAETPMARFHENEKPYFLPIISPSSFSGAI